METTLHRQLKVHYAPDGALVEQQIGRYRIDVLDGDELIEIQLASLSAIRDKIATLLKSHRVRVVKPIVAVKHLVKLDREGGRVLSRRRSPKLRFERHPTMRAHCATTSCVVKSVPQLSHLATFAETPSIRL